MNIADAVASKFSATSKVDWNGFISTGSLVEYSPVIVPDTEAIEAARERRRLRFNAERN